MVARLSVESKINAYNDAIMFLQSHESDSDVADDIAARLWLADRLDHECQRWYNKLKS